MIDSFIPSFIETILSKPSTIDLPLLRQSLSLHEEPFLFYVVLIDLRFKARRSYTVVLLYCIVELARLGLLVIV